MSERVFAGLWLALCAGMGWMAWSLEVPFAYEPVGPKAWPLVLAGLMAASALVLLLRPGPEPRWPGAAVGLRVAAMACALFAYAWTFQWLGFPLATALMAAVVGILFGARWLPSLAGGAVLGGALYFFFDRLLDVVLPLGRLFTHWGR